MNLFLFFPLFTNTITVKNYLTALCKAYPEESFEHLLNKKFVGKESRAVITNKKYDTTEDKYIKMIERDAKLSDDRLKMALGKKKKSDGIQKKRKDSLTRSKRIKKAPPKYTKTDE